jgi:uncharacterized protein YukE
MSKSTLSIVAQSSFDAIDAIKSAAVAIHSGAMALEIINTKAKELKANGVKFGKSKATCANRSALMDSMASQFKGKSSKTYQNYVTSFVAAVNDGAEFSFSGSKVGKGGKAKGKAKTTTVEFSALVAKVFSHADFAQFVADIQEDFLAAHDNDESPKLADYIQAFLEADGFEITE